MVVSQFEFNYGQPEAPCNEKSIVTGRSDKKYMFTSYVKRQNLTMRMHNRRYPRLTNTFLKKIETIVTPLHYILYITTL